MAAQDDDRRVALVGGGEDMVGLAEAARQLRAGEPAGHPELVAFKVRIRGLRGYWTVRGTGTDGSVTVVGGPGGLMSSL